MYESMRGISLCSMNSLNTWYFHTLFMLLFDIHNLVYHLSQVNVTYLCRHLTENPIENLTSKQENGDATCIFKNTSRL